MIILTVKTLDSQNHAFSLNDDQITVRGFKEYIAESVAVPADSQRLIYCGRVLQDDKKLNDYDVNGKVIHLVERAPPQPGQRGNDGGQAQGQGQGQGHGQGWQNQQRPHYRLTRAQMHGNAMYLGAMSVPAEIVEGHGFPVPQLSNSLSNSRLVVARRMLDRVDNLLDQLDNSTSLTNVGTSEGTSEEGTEARPQQTDTPEEPETQQPQEPQQELPPEQQESTSGTNGQANRGGTTAQLPRPPQLGELLDRLLSTQDRLRPYLERYCALMHADPPLRPGIDPLEDHLRLVNGVSDILHCTSHACHALSDIIVDMNQQPPRNLRCRPIIIQHSAILQAGIPIQLEAHISLHGRNANNNNTGEEPSDNVNFVPPSDGAEASEPPEASGENVDMPQQESDGTTPLQQEERQQQDQTQTPFGTVFNLPNNVEVLMEVSPDGNIHDIASGEQGQLAEANNNNNSAGRVSGNATVFPWGSAPTPDFIRNVMQAVAGHMVQTQMATTTITTQSPPVTIGQQTIPGSMDGTSTNGGQSTQARSNVGTHPTTATQTRSTSRPHVFHQHSHPLGIGMNMGQGLDFDPFLPCNSHHIRRTPSTTPSTVSATTQTTTTTNQTSSQEAAPAQTQHAASSSTASSNTTTANTTSSTTSQANGVDPILNLIRQLVDDASGGAGAGTGTGTGAGTGTGSGGGVGGGGGAAVAAAAATAATAVTAATTATTDTGGGGGSAGGGGGTAAGGGGGGGGQPQVNNINAGENEEVPQGYPDIPTLLNAFVCDSNVSNEIARDHLTLFDLLDNSGISENLFPSGEADRGNFLFDLYQVVTQNMTLESLIRCTHGSWEPIAQLRRPLQEFFEVSLRNSASSETIQEHVTERLMSEIRPHLQIHLASQTNTTVRNGARVDLYATAERLVSQHISEMAGLLFNADADDARFGQEILASISNLARQLCSVIRYSVRNGQTELEAIASRFGFVMLGGLHPWCHRWVLSGFLGQFSNYCLRLIRSPESILPLLVYTDAPSQATGESASLGSQIPTVQSGDAEPMETEPATATEGRLNNKAPAVAEDEEEEEVPQTFPGHENLPSDWVPIIARDGVRQRRQLQMQGVANGGMATFSDAYLGGLPSKRRKLIEQQKPRLLVSPTPNHSAITASMERLVREGVGRAGIEEVEGAAVAVAADPGVRRAFGQAIRDCLNPRRYGTPDFPDPLRFPNATKYFADQERSSK